MSRRLEKIREDLEGYQRSGSVSCEQIKSLAQKLGWDIRGGKHIVATKPGKHLLSIPCHPRGVNKNVARGLLKILEEDLTIQENQENSDE